MHQRPTLPTALIAASLALAGCGSPWFVSNEAARPGIHPEDFIGEPQPGNGDDASQPTLVATDDPEQPAAGPDEQATNPRSQEALPIDAMVGHINGEAVYADQIFDVNLIAQLESFGQRFDSEAFREAAAQVIQDRLQGVIINKLILGEAERNLKEAQRRGVNARVAAEREELLRYYGQGSLAKAKAEFRKDRGKELDQHLVDFREELIVGSYIRSKVMPKIVVNQRDVERYYEDHKNKYHQPDRRVIRLIRAVDRSAVEQAQRRLQQGQAFDVIASDPTINSYNPENAGIFNNGDPIPGEKVIGLAPVNKALLKLDAKQHAGPIPAGDSTFFVQVVELEPGVEIPLADAQIQIEQILRSTQFERHALRFRMDLLKRGSYSEPSEMGSKLVEIAYARYDQ